jgi:thiol-disulfide isomerase/thioredoxin
MVRSLAVFAAAALSALASPALAAKIVVGKPAPDFHAVTLDGRKVSLADYKGQVLIINLWATWCAPCRQELPLLDSYERAQAKYGLAMIAVMTGGSAPDSALKPLAKILALPLASRFNGPYANPDKVPTNYVIDRAGVVRYAQAGAFDLDTLNDVLVPLLREAPPPEAPAVPATEPSK